MNIRLCIFILFGEGLVWWIFFYKKDAVIFNNKKNVRFSSSWFNSKIRTPLLFQILTILLRHWQTHKTNTANKRDVCIWNFNLVISLRLLSSTSKQLQWCTSYNYVFFFLYELPSTEKNRVFRCSVACLLLNSSFSRYVNQLKWSARRITLTLKVNSVFS